ncbi:MAG: helix-turn-helix domain-containing protein [Rhodobiaceae bacterium]|nr:helix-turn-helix domain-containing protein [Rhodobiaceae bacterium]
MPASRKTWHRCDIIAELHKRDLTLSSLGRANGYADSTLRASLQVPSRKPNEIIATAIGKTLHELWPHWYGEDGKQLVTAQEVTKQARKRRGKKGKSAEHGSMQPLTIEART